MPRHRIKARIVNNLLAVIEEEMPYEGHREDREFLALRDRIEGKDVELIFTGEDAFEVDDDNYWLPECCWVELDSTD